MKTRIFLLLAAIVAFLSPLYSQGLDAAIQAKIDARIKDITAWGTDPALVEAVRAHNASPLPPEQAALTQDSWKALTVLDPVVRSFTKNPVGQFLKSKRDDVVTEAFVSDAAGFKVGFLSKPSNWCHKGKAKHDVPMTGKTWQGAVETDDSTGLKQLQVAVPVIDNGKAIGSLVVGLSVTKLSE